MAGKTKEERRIKARYDALTAARDCLTDYFLDHCPDGVNWEDFDSDMDATRQTVIDELEK